MKCDEALQAATPLQNGLRLAWHRSPTGERWQAGLEPNGHFWVHKIVGPGGWEGRVRFPAAYVVQGLRQRDGWSLTQTGAEAERRRLLPAFEAGEREARRRAEAEAPLVAARETAAAKEAERQFLLRKKEFLERKLKEQEGSDREEAILELLLNVEKELEAMKGGECDG